MGNVKKASSKKTKYVIDIRNLKQALNHGLFVKKSS